MVIRELVVGDIPTLLAIASAEEGFRVSAEPLSFWTRDQLIDWICARQDVLLGAEIDGEVIGFILTALHQPTGKATCENIFVLQEHRSSGVADALVAEMRQRIKERGATYLHLLVRADATGSIKYYEHRGFKKGYDFIWFEVPL